MKSSVNIRKLVLAALFLALAFVLPFLTGQIPQVGSALAPMHLPVLLCGFICGWPYGLAVGFIAPLLRSVTLGMPPLYPTASAMAFELATYGLVSGLLHKAVQGTLVRLYAALLAAMVAGRLVWGCARYVMAGLSHSTFSFQMFLSGALLTAVPGIIMQLIPGPSDSCCIAAGKSIKIRKKAWPAVPESVEIHGSVFRNRLF
jgi:thiamine transporter ThiT